MVIKKERVSVSDQILMRMGFRINANQNKIMTCYLQCKT
jgi:hypothetical protein